MQSGPSLLVSTYLVPVCLLYSHIMVNIMPLRKIYLDLIIVTLKIRHIEPF